jgi:hypothetical protein
MLAQLYFKQNTYKSTAVYARGNLNYDLYGSGVDEGLKLPLIQTGSIFHAEFLRRIAWKFFLGPRFLIGSSVITIAENGTQFTHPPPDIGLNTQLTSLGVRLTRDTSPNRFYPTSGTYFTVTSDFTRPPWAVSTRFSHTPALSINIGASARGRFWRMTLTAAQPVGSPRFT